MTAFIVGGSILDSMRFLWIMTLLRLIKQIPKIRKDVFMQSIFKELYAGNINLDSAEYMKTPAYKLAVRTNLDCLEKLTSSFESYQKELFDEYSETRTEMESMETFDAFSYALRLGILLMVEAFADGNKITNGIKITIESEGQGKCTQS